MNVGPTVTDLLRNPEVPSWIIRDALLDEGHDVADIYAVVGHTGEYSDYRSWTVAAFLDEAQAAAFRDRLNAWCQDRRVHMDNEKNNTFLGWESRTGLMPPSDDPNFQCDYTGVEYNLETIPLRLYPVPPEAGVP